MACVRIRSSLDPRASWPCVRRKGHGSRLQQSRYEAESRQSTLVARLLCVRLSPSMHPSLFLPQFHSQFFFHALRHRDSWGVASCDIFLQNDCERLSCAVYHTLECLWEVEVGEIL